MIFIYLSVVSIILIIFLSILSSSESSPLLSKIQNLHSTLAKKGKIIPTSWKIIFNYLLIVNIIFLIYIIPILVGVIRYPDAFLAFTGVLLLSGIVVLIDFIAIVSYMITQRPQGIARYICYAALIPISFVLMITVPLFFIALLRFF